MRLLIVTQKVDKEDSILGFFHEWIREFAKTNEKVLVICLQKGKFDLPKNVSVLSLGKEDGQSRLKYFRRFFVYIWQYKKEYDAVFVHMNQIYVLLGGLLWRFLGKRIVLWYAHGTVSISLRVATLLSEKVVTSTEQGFCLKSSKKEVVGQGIDTQKFFPLTNRADRKNIRFVSVGRISPIKDCETILRAMRIVVQKYPDIFLEFFGPIGLEEQQEYFDFLKEFIEENELSSFVRFSGPIAPDRLPDTLREFDVFVSASNTGSLDKAALEAMATGLPVIACNSSIVSNLEGYNSELVFTAGDSGELAEKMCGMIENSGRIAIGKTLRSRVEKSHSLEGLVLKLNKVLSSK